MTPIQKAQSYIRKIRNPLKKQYAAAYLGYLTELLEHEPAHNGLSAMGAQAVRLALAQLLR